MYFKIHRSQLARFCTVFEDMLGVPSGGPDEEMIEDVVVVRMHDDAKDLTNFLSALCNSWSLDFDTLAPQNFPAIAGVMRLATKYDCSVLRSRIFRTLTARYPSPPGKVHGFELDGVPHASVINLARECDIPKVLPSCFYQLAFFGDGLDRGRIGTLAPTDRKRLEKGKDAVLRRLSRLLSDGMPSRVCPIEVSKRSKCITFLNTYWKTRVVAEGKPKGPVQEAPLEELSNLCSSTAVDAARGMVPLSERDDPLCKACKSKFKRDMQRIIHAIWNNLVVDFEL